MPQIPSNQPILSPDKRIDHDPSLSHAERVKMAGKSCLCGILQTATDSKDASKARKIFLEFGINEKNVDFFAKWVTKDGAAEVIVANWEKKPDVPLADYLYRLMGRMPENSIAFEDDSIFDKGNRLKMINELRNNNEHEKCHRLIQESSAKYPDESMFYMELSYVSELLGRKDEALKAAEKTLELTPLTDIIRITSMRERVRGLGGKVDGEEAAKPENKTDSASTDADDPLADEESFRSKIVQLRDAGDLKGAFEIAQESIEAHPKSVGLLKIFCDVAEETGNKKSALTAAEMVLDLATAKSTISLYRSRIERLRQELGEEPDDKPDNEKGEEIIGKSNTEAEPENKTDSASTDVDDASPDTKSADELGAPCPSLKTMKLEEIIGKSNTELAEIINKLEETIKHKKAEVEIQILKGKGDASSKKSYLANLKLDFASMKDYLAAREKIIAASKTEAEKMPDKESVTCGSCGTVYSTSYTFCLSCGERKPANKDINKGIKKTRDDIKEAIDPKAVAARMANKKALEDIKKAREQAEKEAKKRGITVKQWSDLMRMAAELGLSQEQAKEELDDNFEFEGGKIITKGIDMDLAGFTKLTLLPDNFKIKGFLNLKGCTGFTSLPENLEVEGDLHIEGCTGLTSLPKSLKVGRKIFVSDDMNEQVKKDAEERNAEKEKAKEIEELDPDDIIKDEEDESHEEAVAEETECPTEDIWDGAPTETVTSIYESKTVKKGEYLEISFLTVGWPLTIENGAKVKIGTALNGAKIILLGDNAKLKTENDLGADIKRNY